MFKFLSKKIKHIIVSITIYTVHYPILTYPTVPYINFLTNPKKCNIIKQKTLQNTIVNMNIKVTLKLGITKSTKVLVRKATTPSHHTWPPHLVTTHLHNQLVPHWPQILAFTLLQLRPARRPPLTGHNQLLTPLSPHLAIT